MSSKGRKKKLSKSLTDCQKLVATLIKHKDSGPFREKVDWKAWKLDDYPILIKHPMDLSEVQRKLSDGKYKNALEYAHDVRLVWSNCKTYNQDGSEYYKLATKLSKIFEQKFSKIDLSDDLGTVKAPTTAMKKEFSQNIYRIESSVLGNVVTMLDERCSKCIDKTDPDEIEINIDAIDALTFQAVDDFVKKALESAGPSTNKKRKR